ncbi:MAG TPA: PPC domain-containing protein [Tepidisphaeraceae bacterium]|nr:PPC domain-containing protein [Tepidisphaeraceae bacterium]
MSGVRRHSFLEVRIYLLILSLAFVCDAAHAATKKPQAPPPEAFTWAKPWSIAPGRTTTITFYDPELGKPIGMWNNFGASSFAITGSGKSSEQGHATYQITAPYDAQVGIGAVRLLTSRGPSHLQLLMIDDLPVTAQSSGNHSLRSAQKIQLPIAVEGTCQSMAMDYYRFAGKKGQRVSAEIVAQRLGARMDSLLRLLDARGRELAYNDDSPGAGSDSRLSITLPTDGDYFLEVRDVNYDGGAECRYHLRVGNFPLIASAFPAGAQAGHETEFHFDCADGQTLPAVKFTPVAGLSRQFISVCTAPGQGSGFVPIFVDDGPQVVEREPNDSPSSAMAISIPTTINGRLDHPGDRDYYSFHAKRDERFTFAAQTRSIGSPASVRLAIFNSDGAQLGVSKPEGPDDGSIAFAAPSRGIYRLLVEDLTNAAGRGSVYRIRAGGSANGFSLAANVDRILEGVAPATPRMPENRGARKSAAAADRRPPHAGEKGTAGQSVTLKITASRGNYQGAIALSLVGDDAADLKLDDNVIARGKTETDLRIIFPTKVRSTRFLNLRLIGKATVSGQTVEEPVSTEPQLKRLFPKMEYLPPELDGLVGIELRIMNRDQ